MTTQAVSYTVPSNGWTGTIDVTLADLLSDITIKDFKVLYDGTEQGSAELANWAKTSSTLITYSGSSLNQDDVVTVRRDTPNAVVQTVAAQTTIQSSLWNAEFDRQIRWREEKDTFGINTTTNDVSDEVYGSGWNGVTGQAPSKNSVYDKIETVVSSVTASVSDTAYATSWNGVTDVAPSKNAIYDYIEVIAPIHHNPGRMSSVTGNALSPAGNTSTSTLYYVPYEGNHLWLYNTSDTRWQRYTFTAQVTLALSGMSAGIPRDVFVYDNSGTLTLESVAWTNYNTRATAVASQNGIYVKTSEANKRYIGTIVPSGATTIVTDIGRFSVDDKGGFMSIYNYYNTLPYNYRNSAATTDSVTSGSTIVPGAGTFTALSSNGSNSLSPVQSITSYSYNVAGVSSGGATRMDNAFQILRADTAASLSVQSPAWEYVAATSLVIGSTETDHALITGATTVRINTTATGNTINTIASSLTVTGLY